RFHLFKPRVLARRLIKMPMDTDVACDLRHKNVPPVFSSIHCRCAERIPIGRDSLYTTSSQIIWRKRSLMKRISFVLLLLLLSVIPPIRCIAEAHSFKAENGRFMLDGKPFQVISGEMHYARIPRAYWRDRMRMAKAMGLNTITTYVFWNVHEPRP